MVGLCLAVVVASARHFANVAIAGWRSFAAGFVGLRHGCATPERIGVILIGVTAVWLLLLRGLFPGGGGDYYTHYFYYYLEVLKCMASRRTTSGTIIIIPKAAAWPFWACC